MTAHVDVFESQRSRLTGLAYRTLGSLAEAEDAVQETWLRFADTNLDEIREPNAWLTTVVGRICLDVLRSARVRREAYVGPWLPEPLVNRLASADPTGTDPADVATRTEEVSFALLVVLERLTPEQRVAFVLHDVFAVPFDQIATVLGTSGEAARQLATRARRAVADGRAPRRRAALAEQRQAVDAFLTAAQSGDLNALLAVLAPDVVMVGDGGGVVPAGARPVEGALATARFAIGLFRRLRTEATIDIEYALVNGEIGIVMEVRAREGQHLPSGRTGETPDDIRVVMSFVVDDGRVISIFDQLNPGKLTRVPALADLRPPR
jgi:RNA polymerase sigma-70 factor (ECF subfamily)